MAAASLNNGRSILASRIVRTTLTTTTQDLARLPAVVGHFPVVVPIPREPEPFESLWKTRTAVAVGTAELDRKSIDAAPDAPTPEPQLAPAATGHPPAQNLQ